MDNIDQIIRSKRLRLNITQKEFADVIGMPKFGDRTIRRWENNESLPSNLELKAVLNFPELTPFPNNKNAPYTMIDLFAGIGGTRLGFYQTQKTKVVFSSEIDKFAIKAYKANYGDNVSGDITQIEAKKIPDRDILVGGFPCQAFSQAGKKMGFNDAKGTLFFEIARILKNKRPKVFLLENVCNLKTHNGGKTFATIVEILESLNYYVDFTLLKAKDFGLVQNRERIYIVGFCKNQISNYDNFKFPKPKQITTKVGNILEKDVNDKYTISNNLWKGHQRRKAEHIKKGDGFGYSLFDENSAYTNTISAKYYKDGSEILIKQSNNNPRKITPREAARLQGFPDNFIIPVSDTQAYKQFGNSVAVPVINAIAKKIIEILENNKKIKN